MARKFLIFGALILCGVVAFFGIRAASGNASSQQAARLSTPDAANSGPSTPADRHIRTAQSVVERLPEKPSGYNLLAAAYMQKARETGDFTFNARAEEAIARAVNLAPADYDALKLRAKLLLTYHHFPEALQVARQAQAINPRDHDIYGALTDALVELGDYPSAVAAAQTMVDLRPDTASYSRVSYLRQLHGDIEGAIDAMRIAAQAASPADPEKVAWCLVQLGDALMSTGKFAEGEREFDRALFTFPDYHAALAAKARARLAAGDTDKAVEFYRRAIQRVPSPEYVVALGDLYTKLGRTEEARKQYELLEFIERTSAVGGTYSRQMALFWADHETRLDEALAVAQKEYQTRKDIYTADLLAWCLYKQGKLPEAQAAMTEALRLGTRDSRLFYHAGMIANALGDRRNAARYLQQAARVDASFDVLQSEMAERTLRSIKSPTS